MRRQKDLRISATREIRQRFAEFKGRIEFAPKMQITPDKKYKCCRTTSEPAAGRCQTLAFSPSLVMVVKTGTERWDSRLAAGLMEKGGPQTQVPLLEEGIALGSPAQGLSALSTHCPHPVPGQKGYD